MRTRPLLKAWADLPWLKKAGAHYGDQQPSVLQCNLLAVSLGEAAGEILAEAWSRFKSSAARKCHRELQQVLSQVGLAARAQQVW